MNELINVHENGRILEEWQDFSFYKNFKNDWRIMREIERDITQKEQLWRHMSVESREQIKKWLEKN